MGETLNIRSRFWAGVLALAALAMVLAGFAPQARAAPDVVDVNFQQLYFDYTATPTNYENIVGDGKSNGDKVLWKDLIEVDGVKVDALVTTTLAGARVSAYGFVADAIPIMAGEPGDFRVNVISDVNNGNATFTFAFYKGGTYPSPTNPSATPESLELENVQVTAKDIDSRQYNSFVGVRGYTTSSVPGTALTVTKTPADPTPPDPSIWPADIKFQGPTTNGINRPEDQAVVSYASVTETTALMGRSLFNASASAFALTWKFASFGAGTTTSQGQPATVTYDLNGGTGTTPLAVTGVFGEIKGTVATGTGITKSGFTFIGWNTAPNGSGTAYIAGEALTIPATDTTLYANWAGVYTITYNGNNATTGNPPEAGSYTSGESAYSIAGNTGTPPLARTGYIFDGWNTAANGTGTTYAPATSYSSNANLVLYALWTPVRTATLKVKVMSIGTEVTSGNLISEAYDGVEVELSVVGGSTLYKPMQVTPASGEVDFGTVDVDTTYQVRLTAPCDSRPDVTWRDLVVTEGDYVEVRSLTATVPCAPVMSYNLALDEMSWTEPNDGGSRIRYYTYWYNTPARITAGQPWGIFARFWPANLFQVPFNIYGGPTVTVCPVIAVAPNSPAPYTTAPQCSRVRGAPTVGTLFSWKVAARNALSTVGDVLPNGVGWGQWSNIVTTNRQQP